MSILSKISLVLFLVLILVSGAGMSVVDGVFREVESETAQVVSRAVEATGRQCLERLLAARADNLSLVLTWERERLAARVEQAAREPGLGRVLRSHTMTRPQLFSLVQAGMGAGGKEFAFLAPVFPDLTLLDLSRSGAARNRKSVRIRDRSSRVTVPEPVQPLVVDAIREGESAAGVVWLDGGAWPSAVGASSGEQVPSRDTVVLALAAPVQQGGEVVGAVVGGVDLGAPDSILSRWVAQGRFGIQGMSFTGPDGRRFVFGTMASPASPPTAEGGTEVAGSDWSLAVEGAGAWWATRTAWNWSRTPFTLDVRFVGVASEGDRALPDLAAVWEPHQQRLRGWLGLIGVVALVLGIEGARRATASLGRLKKRAELVSTGKVDASFKDLSGRGDVGELARCFERMRISIRKLMDRQEGPGEDSDTEAPFGSVTGESTAVRRDT